MIQNFGIIGADAIAHMRFKFDPDYAIVLAPFVKDDGECGLLELFVSREMLRDIPGKTLDDHIEIALHSLKNQPRQD